tara:strand:- start:366 stop:554 length:189 start_codon:yes stop_codon:yes gene_type:complete
MGMNRLWVEETTSKRVALEKQIYQLLKVELQLMEKKKELYQQYKDLIDDATQAYMNQTHDYD